MSTTTDGFPYPPASDALGNGHQWMQDMAEFLDGNWTPWTSWTPVIAAGFTVGDGAVMGQYRKLFDVVDFRIWLWHGSTSVVTGDIQIEPFPGADGGGAPGSAANGGSEPTYGGFQWTLGTALHLDASAGIFRTGVCIATTDALVGGIITSDDGLVGIGNPVGWGTNDTLQLEGRSRLVL